MVILPPSHVWYFRHWCHIGESGSFYSRKALPGSCIESRGYKFPQSAPLLPDITSRAELGVSPRGSFCLSTWCLVLVWQSSRLHGIFNAWMASEQFGAVLCTPKPFRSIEKLKMLHPSTSCPLQFYSKRGSKGCAFLYVGFQWYRRVHYPRSWYRK